MIDPKLPSQPFPTQATLTLDARRLEPTGSPAMPATLLVPALVELRGYMDAWLQRFRVDAAPPGQSIVIRGAHGAGKTHALGYLMQLVARGSGVRRGDEVRDVLQVYAKAEGPSIVEIYRALMAQIGSALLGELALRFTADLTGDLIAATVKDETEVVAARKALRKDPAIVETMLGQYFVDRGDVLAYRDGEIARLTMGSEDFANAFGWIGTDVHELAHRWFAGVPLDAAERRTLGVTGVIDSAQEAKLGLQLLTGLCTRAGCALVIYVDQYEKLILGPDGKLDREAAGILHTLVEVVPKEDGAIVLAGNEDAYDAMPVDLKQRFGARDVECRPLDRRQCAALVNLYLRPRQEVPIGRDILEKDLAPFTLAGLDVLRIQSGGNARRLIELCASAYERRGDGRRVDAEAAQTAVATARLPRVDADTAVAHVGRVAQAHGYDVVEDDDVLRGDGRAVRLMLGGDDRVLVFVGESHHYYDEALDAVEYVDAVSLAREDRPQLSAIVLVLGYETPEIRDVLAQAGLSVLVYEPEKFEAGFVELVEELEHDASLWSSVADVLTEVVETRGATHRELETKATALERVATEESIAKRWREAETAWVGERRRLEERIAEVRRGRTERTLQGLEQLRGYAEAERTRRRAIVGLVALAAVVLGVISMNYMWVGLEPHEWASPVLIISGLVLTVLLAALYWTMLRGGTWALRDWILRTRAQRELALPVSSLEDLRRSAFGVGGWRPSPSRFRFLAQHANPQFRYAAAAVADGADEVERLSFMLLGERSAAVRLAYAKRIGREPEVAKQALFGLLEAETPDAVYVFEGLLHRSSEVPFPKGRGTDALVILYVLDREAGPLPAALTLLSQSTASRHDVDVVDAALRADLPLRFRGDLATVSTEAIRRAARALSPFEQGGAGTFDDLAAIEEIDRAYLDLMRLQFFSELGLFTP